MLTNYRHTVRLLNRDAWLLLLTVIVVGFSYLGVYVTLFNLYLLRLGYGPVFIGQINAAAQLGFALFSLPAGVLGSRWGSRNIAAAGLGITKLSLGLLPLAEFLPTLWQTGWLDHLYRHLAGRHPPGRAPARLFHQAGAHTPG